MSKNVFISDTYDAFIKYAADSWIKEAIYNIHLNNRFNVALSGGSTPIAIFKYICEQHKNSLDWTKVFLYWSDERCVPLNDKDSNYRSAMEDGCIKQLDIPISNIFPMHAIENQSSEYEKLIIQNIKNLSFDLIMLGIGNDGHTASLFPGTDALNNLEDLVVMNEVPQLKTKRMTLTYRCINMAKEIFIYCSGESKKSILNAVFNDVNLNYPVSRISGNITYILDRNYI